jgi:hypothetical protein
MVHNRYATWRQHTGDLLEIGRLIARRDVNENIERPHGVDRAILHTRQIAPRREDVPDTRVILETFSTQLQWPLAHIDEHES